MFPVANLQPHRKEVIFVSSLLPKTTNSRVFAAG
jgi:hypothetical protein